jgi:autotransporter-associated beta strand protein
VSGAVNLNSATQTAASLTGASTGILTLNGTALTVSGGAAAYAGRITGTGSVTKTGIGLLTLSGATNNFSGGLNVNGGGVALAHANAAGGVAGGPITVTNNALLSLSANIVNPVNLNGATVTTTAVSTPTAAAIFTVTGNNTVRTGTGGGNDLILAGRLEGTGNIILANSNGTSPDTQAFRLRGTASAYSGTITLNQASKFEIQNTTATGSPMGTGTLVMTGGTINTTNGGTYSLVNLRNNRSGSGGTTFGNNVQITGTGSVLFNALGSATAGSTTTMGDLLIGNGQIAMVGATSATSAFNVNFPTVHLTGGNATFAPRPVGNTNFVTNTTLTLGAISENVSNSGITMNGASTLTLTGTNTYTGPTSLLTGTTVLGASASIADSSAITVASGATFTATAVGTLAIPSSQILTANGTVNATLGLSGELRGSGSVTGPVTALEGSQVSPGNSAGILSIGNFDLQTGSILNIELGKATAGSPPVAGTDYDRLTVSDFTVGAVTTVNLAGSLSLTIGAGIETGDIFTIIFNAGGDFVSGSFAGLANGSMFNAGGQEFQISYGDDVFTPEFELSGGNDVSILAVPEPSAMLMLLGGLAACAMRRRRTA